MTATNKCIPGKRIKTWYRSATMRTGLKAFARSLARSGHPDGEIAKRWIAGKCAACGRAVSK